MIGGLAGCDNVAWGGAEFEWRPPPPKEVVEPEVTEAPEEVTVPLPEQPVVFLVRRAGGTWQAEPIGEVAGDALTPLPTEASTPGFTARYVRERLVEGREFTLFQGSTRVGRFIAGSDVRPDSLYCQPRPSVAGIVELIPEVAGRSTFLALPSEHASHLGRGSLPQDEVTRGLGITSYRLVEDLLNARNYRWPPDIASARADVQAFTTSRSEQPLVASTYLYRDAISVGPAPENAYSLFFIGENQGSGYGTTFVWYRPVDSETKGVPRFLTWGDWDGDGQDELLLDVFGSSGRWLAALDRGAQAREWQVAFQDLCGQPPSAAN